MTISPSLSRRLARLLCSVLLVGTGLLALRPHDVRAQLEPERPVEAFADAYALYAEGLYGEATDAFRAFRDAYPEHISTGDALYYQAESALAMDQVDEAVRLFRLFEIRYPAHPLASDAQLALGKHFFDAGDYERAITTLQEALDGEPPPETASRVLYWMGEAELAQDRSGEALDYFRRAAEYRDTPTAPVALYAIAYTQVRLERLDEAARSFEVLSARYPESDYARNLGLALAEVYYELGDYQRVADEVERRMSDLSPEARERATFLMAEAYNQLRDSERAIVFYRRFTESSPESPYYRRALYGLAWNYHFQGVYSWAADHFAQVREDSTDELAGRAAYYEAVNRKLGGQTTEAIDGFLTLLGGWPDHPLRDHALYELGRTYYELRLWEEANETFAQLTAEYPNSELAGEALELRGNTFVALGDFDRAEEAFEEAIELDAAPASLKDDLIFQKAWLQYREGEYASASQAFLSIYEGEGESEWTSDALFWAAESFYQLGELERASELFNQYLRGYSGGKHVDAAHYALGWTHFKQGRYGEAVQSFERFLSSYRERSDYVPYRTDATLRLADAYYALKQYDQAIAAYERVAEEGEDYALFQIGQAAYNAGQTQRAADAFQRLLRTYRDSEWREASQYTLGYLYFQNGDFDQAIEAYRSLIAAAPQDPLAAKAQYGIGDAYFNAGELETSVGAYRRVLEEYADSPFAADAAASIQYALIAMDEGDRAEAIIDSFITANPNSSVTSELRFRQAEVKYQSGRTEEALEDFRRFARSSGSEILVPEAYYYLGTIYAGQGETSQAESYLKQITTSYPESARWPDAARRLGQLYLEEERYQDALAIYRRMERAAGEDARLIAEARYGQGVTLIETGQAEEAETLLSEAVEAAPDADESIPARLGLARLREQEGNADEALELYRAIAGRSRDEVGAEALYRLGTLLLEEGNAERAAEELSRMPALFAGYPEWVAQGYLAQARALDALGNPGDALRLYDRVINEFSGTTYAEEAAEAKAAL